VYHRLDSLSSELYTYFYGGVVPRSGQQAKARDSLAQSVDKYERRQRNGPPRLLKGPPGPRRPFLRSVGPVPGSGPCGALEALQRWQPRGAGAAGQAQRGRSFLALTAPESDSPTDAAGILWHLARILADGLGKSFGGRLTAHAEGLPEVGPTHTSGARSCDRLTQLLLCAPSPLLDVKHLLRPLNLARTAHRRRRS
jgi:hypothetical protein